MSLKASVITEDGEIHIGAPDGSAPVSPLDVNDYYEGKDTLGITPPGMLTAP